METNVESDCDDDSGDVTTNEMALLDLRDLDKTDLESLRGDTIGDTVYSGKWIINTLISLSKVFDDGWKDTLEESLCMLWDMTAERDIVDFLMQNDFLKIAEFTLEASKDPRLTEIVLGIIGNMCCQPAVLEAVSETNKLVSTIFRMLSTDDTETLVQVVRLLQAAAWDVQKNEETKWLQHFKDCEYFGDALSFILQSSTNDALLIATLELLQSISIAETTEQKRLLTDLFKVDRLVPGLFESFSQLISTRDGGHSRTDLRVIENWLTIFTSVMQSEFRIYLTSNASGENFAKMMRVFSRILQPYVHPSNLMTLEDRVAICIRETVEIIFWLQRNNMRPDAANVAAIVSIMHGLCLALKGEASADRLMDPDGEIADLGKYLESYWLETLEAYDEAEILEIVGTCDSEVAKSLMQVATERTKESPDAVNKLLRIESLANSINQSQ